MIHPLDSKHSIKVFDSHVVELDDFSRNTPFQQGALEIPPDYYFYRLADGSYAAYCGHNVVFRLFPEGHEQQARAEAMEAAAVRAELRREIPAIDGGFDALFRQPARLMA